MENKGFTLIELLIVIAIIGILVGIALPSYQEHIRKANRIDIQLEMTDLSLVAERHYARQGNYPPTASFPVATISSYQLEYLSVGTTFSIKATPQNAQASDKCGELTLIQTGATKAKVGLVEVGGCW